MESHNKLNISKLNLATLGILIFLWILTYFHNYLLFHSLVELFSITIAFSIGIIAYNTRNVSDNDYFVFLGIAYSLVALFDLFHTLAYKGMGVFPGSGANLATQLWMSARYLQALFLAFSIIYINKRKITNRVFFLMIGFSILLSFLIFTGLFPTCYVEGIGLTPFKIVSEYFISSILIVTLYLLYLNKNYLQKNTYKYMIFSIIATIIAELAFTLYQDVYGVLNFHGHIFKFFSFFLVYKAISERALRDAYNFLFTSLKKANKELEEKAEQLKINNSKLRKFSRAVEQTSSTVVITDLEGNIEYVNPQFSKTTGYTKEEALGQNPRILKSGCQGHDVYKELWDKISSGKEWRGEFCNKKKNGEVYWEFASISPIKDEEGNMTHYIAIKEDISDRKKLEEELRQAKQMAEEANKAKSDFLAKMSHEIRTPMNGIIGLSEILYSRVEGKEEKRYLKMVINSGKMLLDIINDILDFAKIEAGKLELEKTPLKLSDLVKNTVEMFIIEAQNKGLELTYRIDQRLPDRLIGDPKRIRQIIINFIGNSLKFTDEGIIHLEVKMEAIKDNKYNVKFSVNDTGIGIAEADQEHLFEDFSQASQGEKKEMGTGLGLAISKELAELMEGEIGVNSKPGKGSTFYFTAWLEKPRENSVEKNGFDSQEIIARNKNNKEKISILLAEDNLVNQELIKALLYKINCKVDIVNNGEALLNKLRENYYDLILMDIQMPKMDGFQATRLIRSKEKETGDHIPILALTAHTGEKEKEKLAKIGVDDYIAKPINSSLLYTKIINLTASKTPTRSKIIQKESKISFDANRALEKMNGNKELLKKLIRIMLRDYPTQLKVIEDAIKDKNSPLLEESAHSFKGAIGNFAADKAYKLAYRLEEMGKENNLKEAERVFSQLKKEMEELEGHFRNFIG